jgi:hypothetical protein
MASGYKVRLGDGSEIGPMDLAALKTWHLQGLVDADSPVMRPGTRNWVPLGSLPEFKGTARKARARPSAGASRGRGGAERETLPESLDEEPTPLDRARVVTVGVLLLAAAAGFGFLAWRPESAPAAFDEAPWLQMALGALALGLALLPGWNLARRLVRLALVLVGFAVFPLAGILIAQGERGSALLALGSAWVFVSGLVALLARSLGWAGLALALVPVLAGAAGAVRFGHAAESEAARAVRAWATADRRFTDETLGLTLELPGGWVTLKPGNKLVAAPAEARLTVAQPRLGGLGYLVTESLPRGVATADQYLDRVMGRRRAQRPTFEERSRGGALVGALTGRRVDASWAEDGARWAEVTVAGQDGWMGFALVAWMPEAAAARPGGLDSLARGLAARGLLAVRLQGAVQAVIDTVPHLSAPATELLMAQSEARILEPEQAFRRSVAALTKLIPSLSKAETAELAQLTAATYTGLPWGDRARLSSYIERVRRGETTQAEEDREMSRLLKEAELRLSATRRLRLQAYYEKAIRAAIAG